MSDTARGLEIPEPPKKRPRVSGTIDDIGFQSTGGSDLNSVRTDVYDELDEAKLEETQEPKASDLYLDTVNRAVLDFDFEKLCSVSLSNINIYGCLVCGKYFQGRGKSSYAYAHSIHDDHHVFINLDTEKVYVLPDGYPVSDPSLDDISAVLNPVFTEQQVANLSSPRQLSKPSYDLSSRPYIPGHIGLNNIKANDYLNVVIHSLLHVPPLRDYLLLMKFSGKEPELFKRFSGLAKKLWNPRLFKAQVSPHEFLQEVRRASNGKFKITEQGDPVEFLGWLLNHLHRDMGGTKKRNSSIIYSTFQGEVRIDTQQVLVKADMDNERPYFDIDREIKSAHSPFLFLALDLPPPPIFQDAVEKNILPQVTLAQVLAKYDGKTTHEFAGQLKRWRCTRLPQYIILHYKRFTKNNFIEEKNPTIVNFPVRGADFRDGPSAGHTTVYDLIANVVHESTAGTTRDKENTVWKVHLRAGKLEASEEDKWYTIQDLIIEEIAKEMLFLGETVLQIWERRS
ncbi:spindle pole body protein [Cantharellus anzutake]|uniref:spindle pole body protein n=1 Tax=Cantharellus anzutake TaxID=1750568 RepID=UPI001904DC52|nr:spindle pole body protein [Cantharellus anzutake]KAF8320515.1 spindle pole body protein [Cantharellus anzutake]